MEKAVIASDSTLTLSYSGATTGKNQCLSCIIRDGDGKMCFYGKLANCSEASASSGEVTISLPSGMTAQDMLNETYTLWVFSEQANDDLYSDFAGEPIKVTLEKTETDNGTTETGGETTETGGRQAEPELPQTGDESNPALWVGMTALAAAGFTGTVLFGRKRKYSR